MIFCRLPILPIFLCAFFKPSFALEILAEINPPSIYQTKEGKIRGYFHDYVAEILARAQLDAEIRAIPWKRAYAKTLENSDTALFPTARTAQREKLFKWVGPIGVSYWSFFRKNNDPLDINSLEEARSGGPIGVVLGSAREAYLKQLNFKNLVPAYNHEQLHTLLIKGRIRLIASSEVTTLNHLRQKNEPLDSLERLHDYRTCFLYLALNRDTPDSLVSSLQKALDDIRKNGRLQEIRQSNAPPLDRANKRSLDATLDPENSGKGCFQE
ncbi:substrate-binding periplasmic protein [Kiloniella sp. b19]|uniref:substrate-binding periplasmic protein n=1 Tax=Kiloniella sp. GXU_MW_B19 TaxID=3141326 RepID=UPI0031E06723